MIKYTNTSLISAKNYNSEVPLLTQICRRFVSQNKFRREGKKSVNIFSFLLVFTFIFTLSFVSSAVNLDDLHLNIQTTDGDGKVITGTFDFVFNISTSNTCTPVVYSDSASLTTDSRGIISHYLSNVNLDYVDQYYLCYYRDGSLIETSEIARSPYAFRAKYVDLGGVEVTQNFDLGIYNMTATNFFGDGSGLTGLNASELDLSNYYTSSEIDSFNFANNTWVNSLGNFSAWNKDYADLINIPTLLSNFTDDILWTSGFNSTGDARWLGSGFSESDPLWTSNQTLYPRISELVGLLGNFSAWNKDYADLINIPTLLSNFTDDILWTSSFNATGDTRWLGAGFSEVDPLWSANQSFYIPYTGADKNLVLGNNNFSVGGSDLFVDNVLGRVGIGTSSPGARLDVNGTVAATAFVGDGSGLTGILGSQITNNFNWINSTSLSETDPLWTSNQTLYARISELVGFVGNFSAWNKDYADLINSPTLLSNFTDDLGDRGYNSLSNFTDDILWTGSFNSTGDSRWAPSSGAVSGNGNINYLSKWSSASGLTDSIVYDDGTNVGIGTTNPSKTLEVKGEINVTTVDNDISMFMENGVLIISG